MGLEEELLRIAKKLEKMVARKKTEGALDLLKKLNNCQMSIQLLQTTRIGVAVNGVRKHCSDKEVVSLAKVLIKNWKRLLGERGLPQNCQRRERRKRQSKEERKGARLFRLETRSRPFSAKEERRGRAPNQERLCRLQVVRHLLSKKALNGKTPSSPSTPTFAPSVCLLAPCYLTGDSVRDKCVEMLSAALKAEDDFKDYGVNCDKLASEIEDHILMSYGARTAWTL
ncbi:hypothetical protein U0070_019420 [Myodes glareolus]|uniref:Uncharacterized protein n=1 Tax=Myodes glareolus TaxID=447135 RepID=A0AAW0HN20_MYOGA